MPSKPQLTRHNINLSRQVWGELKLRSFQEGVSASELVAYVVDKYANQEGGVGSVSRYQPRNRDEDRLGRTVFFPPEVWELAQTMATLHQTSVSGLVELWLRRYLGLPELDAPAEPQPPPSNKPPIRYDTRDTRHRNVVRVGEERVYLGENPIHIDLKTGKPKEDQEEEEE